MIKKTDLTFFSVFDYELSSLFPSHICTHVTLPIFLVLFLLVYKARRTFLSMSTMSTTTVNPMLDQAGLPKFASIEPKHLEPAVTTLLEKMETEFADLEGSITADTSYDEVIPVLERIQFPLGFTWGVAGHLNGVKNGEELRAAYEAQQPKVVKAFSIFSQSKPLYKALNGIEKSMNKEGSFEDQQMARAVELSIRQMKLGGVGLEGEAKERFNEIKVRLSELSTKFSNNVLDSTKAWSYTVPSEDAAKLDGVPESAKGMWAQMHAQHVAKDAEGDESPAEPDAEKGPWRITLDGPSYIASLQHVKDRGIRKAVYMASVTKASDLEEGADKARDNVPIINEILKLKYESAKLLGFKNPAERSLTAKMADSVESVEELSELILKKSLPAAYAELEAVTKYAREEGGEEYAEANLENLMPYDVTFWSERFKEAKYSLKEEELRPYFKFEAVLDGMFGLVDRIFGIKCVPADGETEVWNDDVRFFNVLDNETGEKIASFYLDPYSRPADKRGGAWMDVCIGKSAALERDVPVAYLTCNGSPPVGDKPSLMTFREVETLFHEFGHGLQHMLTKASVGDVAGINGVDWDAVELPSQFMENWCYDEPTVYGFAKHYETGEPLPKELFEKLKAQKTYNAGMMACRQLYFGQMDMALHSAYDPDNEDGETIFDVQKRIAAKYSPYNMPLDEDRFLCAFGHIFAGGYSAGYYSYKWAEVMSADAFGAFEDVGLDNEEEVLKVGKKFRDTVLSLGGAVPPSEVFAQFRGREPTPDALLRHSGLN